jgi:hypothetical protein
MDDHMTQTSTSAPFARPPLRKINIGRLAAEQQALPTWRTIAHQIQSDFDLE